MKSAFVKTVQKLTPRLSLSHVKDEDHEDLDLSALEVVKVDSHEESTHIEEDEKSINVLPKPTLDLNFSKPNTLPFFDFMPDEVCVNIYKFLSEEQMVTLGRVCKRFYELLNEKFVWEQKAKNWLHLTPNAKQKDYQEQALRSFYIKKYQENKDKKAKHERQLKEESALRKERKAMLVTDDIIKHLFYERYSMDWPAMIALVIWTILLIIRIDQITEICFHTVNIVFYVILSWFVLGLFSVDFIGFCLTRTKTEWYARERKWKNTKSFMRLFSRSGYYRANGIMLGVSCILFLFLLAEFEENNITQMWPAVIPLIVTSIMMSCIMGIEVCLGLIWLSLTVVWQIAFIWLKGEFYLDINWYATMVPLWIIVGGGFVGMCITSTVFSTCAFSGWELVVVFWTFTWPLGFITGWLVHLCFNLEQEIVDLPMHPWSVVFTLVWVFYAFGLSVCAYIEYKIRN